MHRGYRPTFTSKVSVPNISYIRISQCASHKDAHLHLFGSDAQSAASSWHSIKAAHSLLKLGTYNLLPTYYDPSLHHHTMPNPPSMSATPFDILLLTPNASVEKSGLGVPECL
jgi:hypothetical protein